MRSVSAFIGGFFMELEERASLANQAAKANQQKVDCLSGGFAGPLRCAFAEARGPRLKCKLFAFTNHYR
jgi:hypothetical protein